MGISVSLIQIRGSSKRYLFDSTLHRAYEHLGLAYVASSLIKAGHSVEVVDGLLEELSPGQIRDRVKRFSPNLIGLTATVVDIEAVGAFAMELKKDLPNCHITLGGHLATCAPVELLDTYVSFDSIVIGEGETTAVELAQCLEEGKGLDGINGFCFRDGKRIIRGKPRTPLDTNEIPFPYRYALEYRSANSLIPIARVVTSRGCSFNCKYCTTPVFMSSQNASCWRGRSIENVIQELRELAANYAPRVIIFCDDNVAEPTSHGIERLRVLAEALLEEQFGFKFWIMCRPEVIANNEDLLALLVEAGMWGTFLGIESVNKEQLNYYGRRINLQDYEKAIELLHEYNVVPELGFMMFYPESTKEQLLENADFLLRIGEADQWRYFANAVSVFPGTSLAQNQKAKEWTPPVWVEESEEELEISELCWVLKRAIQMERSFNGRTSVLVSAGELLLKSIGAINHKAFRALINVGDNDISSVDALRKERISNINGVLNSNQETVRSLKVLVNNFDVLMELETFGEARISSITTESNKVFKHTPA